MNGTDTYYQVIADGIVWEDSDGQTEFTRGDAEDLASHVRTLGYDDVAVEHIG